MVLKTTSTKTEIRKKGGHPPFHPLATTLVTFLSLAHHSHCHGVGVSEQRTVLYIQHVCACMSSTKCFAYSETAKFKHINFCLFLEFSRRCMRILETLLPCSMEALSWSIAYRPTASWLPWPTTAETSTKPSTDTTATPSLVSQQWVTWLGKFIHLALMLDLSIFGRISLQLQYTFKKIRHLKS